MIHMNLVQAAVGITSSGEPSDKEKQYSDLSPSRSFQSPPAPPPPHIPAVGQVECDAGLNSSSKLQVSQAPQADIEYSDNSHPQIQDTWKLL